MTTKRGTVELDAKTTGESEVRSVSGAYGELDNTLTKMASSLTAANLASKAITATLGKLKDSIGDVIDIAINWEDWVGSNSKALDGLSQAVDGMIDKLKLSRVQTVLTTGDFQATERQLKAVAVAGVTLARLNKEDLAPSLRRVTDAIVGGRTIALKQLGIAIDLTGTAAEKSQKALALLEDRFGGVELRASNTAEKQLKFNASITDAIGELTSLITKTDAYKSTMSQLADGIGATTRALQAFNRESEKGVVGAFQAAALARAKEFQRINIRQNLSRAGLTEEQINALFATAEGAGGAPAAGGGSGGGGLTSSPGFQILKFSKDIGLIPSSKKGKRRPFRNPLSGAAGAGRLSPENQFGLFGGEAVEDEFVAGAESEELARIDNINRLADQFVAYEAGALRAADATRRLAAEMRKSAIGKMSADFSAQLTALSERGLTSLATGLLSAADAAISGSKGFGEAILMMLKSVTLGLSSQLIGHAIHATFMAETTAINPLTAWQSPLWSAQATKYWIGSGVLAGLGLGMSGIAAAAGGGGGGGAARGGAGGIQPSFGRDRERETERRELDIDVYLVDETGAQASHRRKGLRAEVRERN